MRAETGQRLNDHPHAWLLRISFFGIAIRYLAIVGKNDAVQGVEDGFCEVVLVGLAGGQKLAGERRRAPRLRPAFRNGQEAVNLDIHRPREKGIPHHRRTRIAAHQAFIFFRFRWGERLNVPCVRGKTRPAFRHRLAGDVDGDCLLHGQPIASRSASSSVGSRRSCRSA